MPITMGTVLGRYRMLERAGMGGMSEVWKAEDETLKRTVAVKVILGPVAQDPTFRERFLREARLVAGLEHPNVLPVYDYGSSTVDGEDVSYLVMPLVAGGSLKGRIAGPVPPPLAVSWLAAIASALDHAHAKGILHRDIKPANVLMDSQSRPLLADFGLARSSDATSGLTATGTVMGTPLYMAPEQATGGKLDGRADEYALAVVAFELLSGRVPFIADSPLAVLHQQVTAPPPPLSTVLPGSPASADAVLAKALAKKAEERYSSCGAFVRALGDALGVPSTAVTVPQAVTGGGESQLRTVVSKDFGAPPLAAPASVPVSGVDPTQRTKWALAAILLLSAAGGALLLLRGTGRPGATSEAETKPTPGISLSKTETPATATAATSTDAAAPSTTEISDSSKVSEAAAAPGTAGPAVEPTPHTPFKEKSENPRIASGRASGNSTREEQTAPRPKQTAFPPLLSGAGFSGDTQLSAAWEALDTHRRARLTREDFVNAMGAARAVLARRPTAEVRFLDTYARAGVAYADGRNADAWQLLTMALRDSGPAAETRVMRFVAEEVHAIGPNPGPDAEWVMGLAFGDARGELRSELDKAQARAPRSPRVQEARAISNR